MAWNPTKLFEPQYLLSGWYDDGGMSMDSWFDQDYAGTIIFLVRAEPPFFINQNIFFTPPPITYEVLAPFFVNESTFFYPVFVRILGSPDQMIKNEVLRVR